MKKQRRNNRDQKGEEETLNEHTEPSNRVNGDDFRRCTLPSRAVTRMSCCALITRPLNDK